ncbi:MAG: hydrogenase formation protein HypD, partial [Mariniphaga sp.]|nr:hydrogenase formation protein HypD [Mariniphaga sp.]
MKYIDEYRNLYLVKNLINQIKLTSKKKVRLMEVCGGHTMAIQKFGIPSLLPENIELLSGPGCPVCVTDKWFIDKAITYSRLPDVVITTYGDLIRVPGSDSSLEKEKARGSNIKIVYSPLDALSFAKENPNKKIIFLGIGFETTSPASAITIIEAKKQNIENFLFLNAHKIMPPAMKALIHEGIKIDGYICPGHVSTITGSEMYLDIVSRYGVG